MSEHGLPSCKCWEKEFQKSGEKVEYEASGNIHSHMFEAFEISF